MKRISVSILESFRRMQEKISSFDTEECFIKKLAGEYLPTEKTIVGTGFHSLIEGMFNKTEAGWLTEDDNGNRVVFTDKQKGCADYISGLFMLPRFEQKIYKEYTGADGKILLSARLDCIENDTITDFKTTFHKPFEKVYTDSLQWKAYLDITGLKNFIFQPIEVRKFKFSGSNNELIISPDTEFLACNPIKLSWYEGINTEIEDWISECTNYIYDKGLEKHLKEADEYIAQ